MHEFLKGDRCDVGRDVYRKYQVLFSAVNLIGLTPERPQLGPPGYEINLLYIAGLVAR